MLKVFFSVCVFVFLCLQPNLKMSKGITEADKYEFKLSAELATIAEKELRETPAAREFALNALREWIKKNPRIVAVRLGKY